MYSNVGQAGSHGFGNDPYFVRRRWDFFVRYLLSVPPPEGFKISPQETPAVTPANRTLE